MKLELIDELRVGDLINNQQLARQKTSSMHFNKSGATAVSQRGMSRAQVSRVDRDWDLAQNIDRFLGIDLRYGRRSNVR